MLCSSLILLFALVGASYGGPMLSDRGNRIVGGAPATEAQFPYQVSLRSDDNAHFCGGAIISDRWVLTAYHCLAGANTPNIVVVVGTLTLDAGGQSYIADKLIFHSDFNPETLANDIGLLRVATPFVFSNTVAKIDLATEDIPLDKKATVSGWGQTSIAGSIPNVLQWVNVTPIQLSVCRNKFFNSMDIGDYNICTYTGFGVGNCKGDSGGPLTSAGKLYGIVSWGFPCAIGYPDVYTNVKYYRSWIIDMMNQNSL